jgi:hypothetical protein
MIRLPIIIMPIYCNMSMEEVMVKMDAWTKLQIRKKAMKLRYPPTVIRI